MYFNRLCTHCWPETIIFHLLIFIALQKANLIPCAYDYDFAMVTAFGIMVIMKEKYALSLTFRNAS